MKKPVEELLAVVVALAVMGLAAVSFVSFLTFKSDLVDEFSVDGGQSASSLEVGSQKRAR